MPVDVGTAVGYLDLDTSKFKTGLKSALGDLKLFQSKSATMTDKLAGFSSAATSAGRSLTKGLTLPLVGVGAASLAVTAKFDKGMSKVKAISGATTEEMEKLRAKAKEMGAQTKFSASESAEAFNYMAMAGWKTEDMLDGIEGIMNLAAASGEDLATTSDIVTDALTAFGLSAKDSTHFADVLAAASSNANTNVSMMGETFKYVAPVAGALGFSVEDVSTAIGLMANSGIKGSQAGTALRQLFTKMAKPTKESAAAMEKLGVSLTDSSGQMKDFDTIMGELREGFAGLTQAEKAQTASALSGQYGMSGLLAIVNASDEDFEKLKNAIYDADGASKQMADTMLDNLPGAITLAKSALEGLGIRIGEVITPAITKVVQAFTGFVSWLSQASDRTVAIAVGFGVFLAAVGPVLLILGSLAGCLVNLINAYQALSKIITGKAVVAFVKSAIVKAHDTAATVANTAANIANKASFSGLGAAIKGAIAKILALAAAHKIATAAAFGIVGAVVGLAIYMKKTGTSFSELKDKILAMFQNLVQNAPKIMKMVTGVVSGIIQQLPSILKSAMTALKVAVKSGVESLKDTIPQIADWWQNNMPAMVEVGASMIANIIDGLAESLPTLIQAGATTSVQLIAKFSQQASKFMDVGVKMITSMLQGLSETAPQVIAVASDMLAQNLQPMIEKSVEILTGIAMALVQNLPVLISALTTILTSLLNLIAQSAPAIIEAAFQIIVALAAGLIQATPQILSAIAQIALALVQAVLAIAGALLKAGIKLLQALWKGINSWAGTLRAKMKETAKKALLAFAAGLGNLVGTGIQWLMGLWNGIKSRVQTVVNGVSSFARSLPSRVTGALGSLFSAGANFIAGLWNGMASKISGVISNLRNKLSAVKNLAAKIFEEHSPSRVTFQQGVWFMQGLENGINEAYKSLLRNLTKQMEGILDVYNPLKDYDFGIGESADAKLLNKLDNMSLSLEDIPAGQTVVPVYITVEEANNGLETAHEIAQAIKDKVRTE